MSTQGTAERGATESLRDQFEALHVERTRTWSPEQLARNIEQRQRLVAAFDPARAVQAGDRIAPFTLEDSRDGTINLGELIARGPAVLIFFRFAGCPACNLALPYYDRQLRPELDRRGISLVAVSPHLPEQGLDAIRDRHALRLRVASDRDLALARRLGIGFDRDVVPDGQPSPGWLGELTGTGTAELPQPAVILIDRDAIVRYVSISPDWLDRPEAPEILAAIDALDKKAAA